VFFGLLGFNVYLNYKKTSIKEQAEKERQEAKKQLEEDERLKREIAEMTKQKLTG
ncbi:35248_t:CDS:1, partial [Racocetra persica]